MNYIFSQIYYFLDSSIFLQYCSIVQIFIIHSFAACKFIPFLVLVNEAEITMDVQGVLRMNFEVFGNHIARLYNSVLNINNNTFT